MKITSTQGRGTRGKGKILLGGKGNALMNKDQRSSGSFHQRKKTTKQETQSNKIIFKDVYG